MYAHRRPCILSSYQVSSKSRSRIPGELVQDFWQKRRQKNCIYLLIKKTSKTNLLRVNIEFRQKHEISKYGFSDQNKKSDSPSTFDENFNAIF